MCPVTSVGDWLANAADAIPARIAIRIAWRTLGVRIVMIHSGTRDVPDTIGLKMDSGSSRVVCVPVLGANVDSYREKG